MDMDGLGLRMVDEPLIRLHEDRFAACHMGCTDKEV